jgi:hypothetical protein
LKIEMTLALPCSAIGAGVGKVVTALPVRLAVVTTSSSFVDIALKRETSFYRRRLYACAACNGKWQVKRK